VVGRKYEVCATLLIVSQFFGSLRHRGDDLRVHTGLATAWQQLDLARWRFTLRGGVKFAGGEDFDSPDTSHLCDPAMLSHVCFRASL